MLYCGLSGEDMSVTGSRYLTLPCPFRVTAHLVLLSLTGLPIDTHTRPGQWWVGEGKWKLIGGLELGPKLQQAYSKRIPDSFQTG